MSGTTYVYEPVLVPIDAGFSAKSGLTTDEAVFIKDYVLYMAKYKYSREEFNTTSEIIMQAKRAEQAERQRIEQLKQEFVANIDWFKVAMALIIVMFVCNWIKNALKEGF